MRKLALCAFSAFSALCLSGCFTTHIHSGKPAAPGEPALDNVLRSQIIGDVVTIDPPDKLSQRCPQGWSRIDAEVRPFNWILDVVAGFFYHSNTVSLRCAAPGAAPTALPPTQGAEPLPPAPAVLPPPPPPPQASPSALPPPPPGFTPM
jgi:hypothetical protein